MPSLFELRIMAPDHSLFEGQVQAVVAPGVEGQFGVLYRHAPMVAELGPGALAVTDADGRRSYYAVSSGVLEVRREGVVVLADAAEAGAEIDPARARAAEERARERLRSRAADTDIARAEAALRRALVRREVAGKVRKVG